MNDIKREAFFSPGFGDARVHRYSLIRSWDYSKPLITFIGLNPSRADEVYDDPTIRRVIKFAKDWDYGGLFFGNLYSFRTPDPKILVRNLEVATDHFTNQHLQSMISNSKTTVICWGSWYFTAQRVKEVLKMIPKPFCFGVNQDGSPKHPLYLKGSTLIFEYPNN